MKNSGIWTGTPEASFTNRIKKMEDRLSGIDKQVKENIKSKKSLTQNIQESWDTMKDQTYE